MKSSEVHFLSASRFLSINKSFDFFSLLTGVVLFSLTAGSAYCQSTPASPSAASSDPKYKEMVKVEGGRLKAAKKSVKDFKIGKYEVTKGEWQEVANWATANGYDLNASGCNPGDTTPVGQVSWYDIVKWCNAKSEMERLDPVYYVKGKVYKTGIFGNEDWDLVKIKSGARGYRLPTLAEWEWAARGGKKSKGYTYAGSNNLDDVAWHSGNPTWRHPQPAGSKQPNELGIYDMHGNVSERTWDFVNCGGYFRDKFTSQFVSEFQIPTRSQQLFERNKCLDLSNQWDTVPMGFRVALDAGGL
jgi:formylglycine-generating enzyme required for sulfatase activity